MKKEKDPAKVLAISMPESMARQFEIDREFLSAGMPINFSVPKQPGAVISGLRLGDRVLVRRTDFTKTSDPVEIAIDDKRVNVGVAPKNCQIISIR